MESYSYFDVNLVLELSEKFRKHPGIIVAQMQRKGVIGYNDVELNALKPRVEFGPLKFPEEVWDCKTS